MHVDGLSTGWKMLYTCKGTFWNKINMCSTQRNKCSLLKPVLLFNGHIVYTWLNTNAGSISGIPMTRYYPAPPAIHLGSQPFSFLGLGRRYMEYIVQGRCGQPVMQFLVKNRWTANCMTWLLVITHYPIMSVPNFSGFSLNPPPCNALWPMFRTANSQFVHEE